jgi:excisionase family DNA binding protein
MAERLLTPEEAAGRLAISAKTIRNWLREGKLQGVKVGRLWRLREGDLSLFLPAAHDGGESPADPARGAVLRATVVPVPKTQPSSDGQAFSDKHIHLLRSTYRVLAERGLQQLSLQHVAEQAGVSKGILLYYFGSKENLILATMRWVLGRVAERIRTAVFKAATTEEKVTAMLDAIFIDPKANRDFYLVLLDLLSTAARLDRFDEISATFRTTVNGVYAHIIEQGIAQGTFHITDANEAAAVVRGIIDGLFLQWLQERDREALHARTRETCKRAVLAYLRAERG